MRLGAPIAALTGAYWLVLGNAVPNLDDSVDTTCLSTSAEVATATAPDTSCSTTSLQHTTTSALSHSTADSAPTASTGIDTDTSASPTVVTITITTSPASSVDFTSSNLPVSISGSSTILGSSSSQSVSAPSSCTEDRSDTSPASGTAAGTLATGRSPAAVTVSPDINSAGSITATEAVISGTTKVLTFTYPDGLTHTATKLVTVTIPDITWNPTLWSTESAPTITTVTIPAVPTAAAPSQPGPYEVTYTLTPDDVFSEAFTGTVTLTPSSPALTVDQGHPEVSSPVETAVTMTYTAFVSGSTLVTTVTEYPLLVSGTPVVTVLTPHPVSNSLGSVPIVPLTITLTSAVVTTPTPKPSNALPEASGEDLGATTVTETAFSTGTIFETGSFDPTPSSPAPGPSSPTSNTVGSVVHVTYTIPGQPGGDASTYTVTYTAPAVHTQSAEQGGASVTSEFGSSHVTVPSSSSTDALDSSETPYTVTVTPVDVSRIHNPVTITYTLHATTADITTATVISTGTQTVTDNASGTEDSGYGAPTNAQSSIDNGNSSSSSTADSYGSPTMSTASEGEGDTGQPSFSTPTVTGTTSDSGGYQYGTTTTEAPSFTWTQATASTPSSSATATAVVSKVTLTETVSLGPHSSTVLSFTTDVTLVAGQSSSVTSGSPSEVTIWPIPTTSPSATTSSIASNSPLSTCTTTVVTDSASTPSSSSAVEETTRSVTVSTTSVSPGQSSEVTTLPLPSLSTPCSEPETSATSSTPLLSVTTLSPIPTSSSSQILPSSPTTSGFSGGYSFSPTDTGYGSPTLSDGSPPQTIEPISTTDTNLPLSQPTPDLSSTDVPYGSPPESDISSVGPITGSTSVKTTSTGSTSSASLSQPGTNSTRWSATWPATSVPLTTGFQPSANLTSTAHHTSPTPSLGTSLPLTTGTGNLHSSVASQSPIFTNSTSSSTPRGTISAGLPGTAPVNSTTSFWVTSLSTGRTPPSPSGPPGTTHLSVTSPFSTTSISLSRHTSSWRATSTPSFPSSAVTTGTGRPHPTGASPSPGFTNSTSVGSLQSTPSSGFPGTAPVNSTSKVSVTSFSVSRHTSSTVVTSTIVTSATITPSGPSSSSGGSGGGVAESPIVVTYTFTSTLSTATVSTTSSEILTAVPISTSTSVPSDAPSPATTPSSFQPPLNRRAAKYTAFPNSTGTAVSSQISTSFDNCTVPAPTTFITSCTGHLVSASAAGTANVTSPVQGTLIWTRPSPSVAHWFDGQCSDAGCPKRGPGSSLIARIKNLLRWAIHG